MDLPRVGWRWGRIGVLALVAGWPTAASAQYRLGNLFSPPTYEERAWAIEKRSTARGRQAAEEPVIQYRTSSPAQDAAPSRRVTRTSNRSVAQEGRPLQPAPAPTHEEVIHEDHGSCDDCGECWDCRPRHRWVRIDYLHWWTKGMEVPALVTTAPTTGTGVLGAAGTEIAFGDTAINDDSRSGARITYGWDWNPCDDWSAEISYMILDTDDTNFELTNPANQILARPFFNIAPAAGAARQDANIVANPNVLSGFVGIESQTDYQAAEALLRRVVASGDCTKFDVLMGYRFSKLEDSIGFAQSQTVLTAGQGFAIGTNISFNEAFQTRNEFHGAQLGFQSSYRRCRWTLDLLMKLGIGQTSCESAINGQTTVTVPGAGSTTSAGGLLTQPSNIATVSTNHFSVMPELGLSVRYDITPCLRATAGYSFTYWSKVARAGEQIDSDVNLSQQPPGPFVGSARPEFGFQYTDFWAQGVHAGLELQF